MSDYAYAYDPKRARRTRRDRSRHFVYECYDVFDQPLYVGSTSEIGKRLTAHAAARDWWPYVHTIKMASYDNKDAALTAEYDRIRQLTPRYNTQGLTREQIRERAEA